MEEEVPRIELLKRRLQYTYYVKGDENDHKRYLNDVVHDVNIDQIAQLYKALTLLVKGGDIRALDLLDQNGVDVLSDEFRKMVEAL